jgi:hypothetical protein
LLQFGISKFSYHSEAIVQIRKLSGKLEYGWLSDNGRLVNTQVVLQLAKLESDVDQALQAFSSRLGQFLGGSRGGHIAFNVHANGSTLASSSAKTEHNPRTVGEGDDLTLILGH